MFYSYNFAAQWNPPIFKSITGVFDIEILLNLCSHNIHRLFPWFILKSE